MSPFDKPQSPENFKGEKCILVEGQRIQSLSPNLKIHVSYRCSTKPLACFMEHRSSHNVDIDEVSSMWRNGMGTEG